MGSLGMDYEAMKNYATEEKVEEKVEEKEAAEETTTEEETK